MQKTKTIKFLVDMDEFKDKQNISYGPYKAKDIAQMPVKIATLLVKAERAIEIKNTEG